MPDLLQREEDAVGFWGRSWQWGRRKIFQFPFGTAYALVAPAAVLSAQKTCAKDRRVKCPLIGYSCSGGTTFLAGLKKKGGNDIYNSKTFFNVEYKISDANNEVTSGESFHSGIPVS